MPLFTRSRQPKTTDRATNEEGRTTEEDSLKEIPDADADKSPDGTTEEGADEGRDESPEEGPDKGRDESPRQALDQDPDPGADKGPDGTANQGPDEAPDQGADKRADQGADKGAEEGAKGPDVTADKGPDVTADGGEPETVAEGDRAAGGGWRQRHPAVARTVAWTTTGLAAALVLVALSMPTRLSLLTFDTFVRIPVEAIFGAALLLILPTVARRVVAVLAGLALGALTILNVLDIGFNEFLGRGFNVVLDWILLDDAESYLRDSIGPTGAKAVVIGAVTLVLLVLVLMALAVLRIGEVMARNSTVATRTTLVLGTVWVLSASLGVQSAGQPFASRSTSALVQDRAERVRKTLKDEEEFAKEAAVDVYGDTPGDQLLTELRGKDVMITFIESYGRAALEDPLIAPGVDEALKDGTKRLRAAGYSAKSGWLTSATFGGSSWLGHSTFLTGLWIDNQNRYRTVTAGDHLSLTRAFQRTGAWRTVGIMPGITKGWPEGTFYGLDHVYDSRDLGYKGPKFSWSTMPDQYALTAFERLEHGKRHDKPLMSEIILTSSHQPWAPVPKMIGWDEVGDGSVYEAIRKEGKSPTDVFTDSTKVRTEYGRSIEYSLDSLLSYLAKYGNKNTVLVFLGDHQPLARVSGDNASRDVPVTIVAHDKDVLDRISDWGWQDGLKPGPQTPVWRMDTFRDRFLAAYGSRPSRSAADR